MGAEFLLLLLFSFKKEIYWLFKKKIPGMKELYPQYQNHIENKRKANLFT